MPYRNIVLVMGHVVEVNQNGSWINLLLRTKSNYKPKDGEAADVIVQISCSEKYGASLLDCHPGALVDAECELRHRVHNERYYTSLMIQRYNILWNTKPKAQQEPPPRQYQAEDRPPPLPPQPELPKQDNEDQIPF